MTEGPRKVGKGPLDMKATAARGEDARLSAPAALRNRDAILTALRTALGAGSAQAVLEIGCGTGEHAAHFARHEPGWTWTPSDPAPTARASAAAWCADLPNAHAPLALDVLARDAAAALEGAAFDAVYCANMIHIAPWDACEGLMRVAAYSLKPGGRLLLYGPFIITGEETAEGNIAFDASLRAQNPDWGVRALDDVAAAAAAQDLGFKETNRMPANNVLLAFEKGA